MAKPAYLAILMGATAAAAASAAPPPVQRLSDAEIAKVLDEAAVKREAVEATAPPRKIEVHGEVGVEIGSDGYRAYYGSAFIPFGDDGGAMLSMSNESGREPYRRIRRDRY